MTNERYFGSTYGYGSSVSREVYYDSKGTAFYSRSERDASRTATLAANLS